MLSLTAAPLWAQDKTERQETTVSLAPSTGGVLGVEWLGPHTGPTPVLNFDGPWQGRGAMVIEQRLAQQVIRSFWPDQIPDARAAEIIDGFSYYLQTVAIEHLFDLFYLRKAHSVESRPYFGGHVVWSFPTLRLSRHAVAARNRHAATFESLDRWIGTPNLQGAMYQVAHLQADQLTAPVIIKTISDAAGQDLSWAFDAAASSAPINYAVTGLSSSAGTDCTAPCVDTTITVAREGAGMYSGRSAQRSGEFDAGDALQLRVTYADGTTSLARWDGRDETRAFQFRGPSAAVAAHLDPDRIVTLDSNLLDNAIVTPAPTNVPVGKWVARWMVWLQHTMLSYGFLA